MHGLRQQLQVRAAEARQGWCSTSLPEEPIHPKARQDPVHQLRGAEQSDIESSSHASYTAEEDSDDKEEYPQPAWKDRPAAVTFYLRKAGAGATGSSAGSSEGPSLTHRYHVPSAVNPQMLARGKEEWAAEHFHCAGNHSPLNGKVCMKCLAARNDVAALVGSWDAV